MVSEIDKVVVVAVMTMAVTVMILLIMTTAAVNVTEKEENCGGANSSYRGVDNDDEYNYCFVVVTQMMTRPGW